MTTYSPTQLTNFLSCNHLGALELAYKENLIKRPFFKDPISELLKKQGDEHEHKYLLELKEQYKNVVELSRGNIEERAQKTVAAMRAGADVIFQAALKDNNWQGYSDFLIKVDTPSDLGDYSYKIEDTKLSAEVKGEAIMQLCIYAELVRGIQGRLPDEIAIVGGTGEKFSYDPNDFMAYLHYSRSKFLQSHNIDLSKIPDYAPEPVDRCHTCNWRGHCEERWHATDHLKLVPGAGRLHRKELRQQNILTLTVLAQLPQPPKFERGANEVAEKIYRQAKIQLKGRQQQKPLYEFILPVTVYQGLAGLPEPCQGDIWFDIEGDAHIGKQGLEYLFGWISHETHTPQFHEAWALNSLKEKQALEKFIRFVLNHRKLFPGMHVYHFGHYETSVVRRLSTRYNLLVDEVDDLLRNEVFIDLHRVVKNGLRLSVEGYGLKEIEGHYAFERKADLHLASQYRKTIALLLDAKADLVDELVTVVQEYNEEDCLSTFHLHQWLEQRRTELIQKGTEVPRYYVEPKDDKKNEALEELARLSILLIEKIPDDPEEWTTEQQVTRHLADLLMWYRREDKSFWWEFFRLDEKMSGELLEERKALGGPFKYIGEVGEIKQSKLYRFKYRPQVYEGGNTDEVKICGEGGPKFSPYKVDTAEYFLDVKRSPKSFDALRTAIEYAQGLFVSKHIKTTEQVARFKALAEQVLEHGFEDMEQYIIARNLLFREQVLGSGTPLKQKGEKILDAAIRLALDLKDGVILPIQGPPGTGKTFTAAHMICELIKAGKKVGITAQGHSVVLNLMNQVHEINKEKYDLEIDMIKQNKDDEDLGSLENIVRVLKSADIETENQFNLIGGTAWLWSRQDMCHKVDVLFIDEAGQFALADAIAVSHCAHSMVLLGDPQQLENVTQGVHPPEIEVSVLGYWLGDQKVISDDQGLFLENTYRMHPAINQFISDSFYESKLAAVPGLEKQSIVSKSMLNGSGVRFIPCEHEGNQSSSTEEVALIKKLVEEVLKDGSWINNKCEQQKLQKKNILIVSPYNAQVNAIREALPGCDVGTVDKFQGRQAPVVIFSMATSSPEEAPRGMEFLYSLNRLNVAMSRAQCLAVMVASPQLFELSCKTPQQMRLANAYCRFLEMVE